MFGILSTDNKISNDTFGKAVLIVVMMTCGNKFESAGSVPTIITSKILRSTSVLPNTLYKKFVGL
jgi:hypothetical protein